MKNIFNATATWVDMAVFLKAAENGDNAGVREFLDKYPNAINKKGAAGWTALMMAAWHGHTTTVEFLLENGAALTSSLISAARGGHDILIKLLLERGADINEKNTADWTALMMAAWHGHTATVEYLLERGADIEAKNKSGDNAMMLAMRVPNSQLEAAAVLKEWPEKEQRRKARELEEEIADFSPALKRDLPALRALRISRQGRID